MIEGGFQLTFQVPDVTDGVTLARMVGRPSKHLSRPPNRLREVREARGISQETLGKAVGKTGETVRKWEIGKVSPTLVFLERCARFLNVPTAALLNDYEPGRDSEEREILKVFRRLHETDRERAITVLAALGARLPKTAS